MSYRSVLGVAAIAAGVVLWAGAASAVTFTGTGTATATVATYPAGPDISIDAGGGYPYYYGSNNQFDVNFDLANPGDTYNASNLFSISAYNLYKSGTDTIAVDFAFTAPSNGATGTITATAVGHTSYYNSYLEVTWANPLTLSFDNGASLQIQLGTLDTTKSCTWWYGQKHCTYTTVLKNPQDISGYNCYGGSVDGTFTYIDQSPAVSATPLPAGLPLFVSGMGVLGGFGFWRKRKAQRAAA